MSKLKNYEGAITLLSSVPSEVNCYKTVQNKAIEIYNSYQTSICSNMIQNAMAFESNGDYSSAINTLGQVDPASKCGRESKELLAKIQTKVDYENKQRINILMQLYKDELKLEQQRISAIRDIAITYAKNQPKPPVNNYLLIVR